MTATFDGQRPGWSGHVTKRVMTAASDSTLYDPPLRVLTSSAGGQVVFLCSEDDENDNTLGSVSSSGTTPPTVTLTGTPLVGVSIMKVDIVVGGTRGTATFRWSLDNGTTWSSTAATAASIALTGSGLTVNFATGTYNADNLYSAFATNAAYFARTLSPGQSLAHYAIKLVRAYGTDATGLEGFR